MDSKKRSDDTTGDLFSGGGDAGVAEKERPSSKGGEARRADKSAVMSAAGGGRDSWVPVRIDGRSPRRPTGRIHGTVYGPDGETLPARVMLEASDGRSYTEEGGFHRLVPATRTHYQHTSGVFDKKQPCAPVESSGSPPARQGQCLPPGEQ